MTLDPFAPPGEGVYIDPIDTTRCRCGVPLAIPSPGDGRHGFDFCPDHDCCAIWLQTTICPWTTQWVEDGNADVNPHFHCPNLLITNDYYPIQYAMVPNPVTGERAVSAWNPDDGGVRPFPVDMFYRLRLPNAIDEATSKNAEIRDSIFRTGVEMFGLKAAINTDLAAAEKKLEAAYNGLWTITQIDGSGGEVMTQLVDSCVAVRRAFDLLTVVFECLEHAAYLHHTVLGAQWLALEYVGRLPKCDGPTEVSAADGSYKVSLEKLGQGDMYAARSEVPLDDARASGYWVKAKELWGVAKELEKQCETLAAHTGLDDLATLADEKYRGFYGFQI